ncbi:hypothetical protein [Luteimonas yindakuii]|uniref:hypothetical protein n=1 Tax=Luteimonas yindakuii TaxID=2565782 RepID=UPI00140A09D1|nr:hypothetical protein [Luteimonas yindakuii]
MQARPGRVRGAPAPDIVSLLAAREPTPLPPGEVLENRWQAFTVLWRQHWERAPDDERGMRRLSSAVSGVLHLVWLFLLGWLMVVPPWTGPTQAGEDSAIEVTWIGEGTPRDEGAGPPAAGDAIPEVADSRQEPSPPPLPPAAQPDPVPASVAEAATPPPEPRPEPAPAAAEQPLVVTETAVPDTTFVVPPPPEVPVLQPRLRERTVELRDREIPVQEPVELARPELPALRPVAVTPSIEQPVVELAEREVVAPVRLPDAPRIAAPSVRAPVVEADAPAAPVREIALRETSNGQGASETVDATRATAAAGSTSSDAAPAADAGTRPDATAAGAGPATSPAPGAIPSPRSGDDWDTAAQNRAGGQAGTAGLFNRDGRPQLPPGAGGRVGGGLPPGTVTEDYEKIDRMGTWLRRPPSDFEPTSLDRFWVPHENLLEEWVRRSIRTVLIPIPGTSKSIRCDVALLAFGGGCGITDPNLQDVEAGARPPPDVPYKPELQEGDDAR